jgi:Zn-dependent M28 family amino/carboxypeptidase
VREIPLVDEHCASTFAAALAACVDSERLRVEIARIAKPRPPGSRHHRWVRELCQARLASFDYEVELLDYGTGVDVIGVKPGVIHRGEQVVVSAHYDHLDGCDGADDNASGVAGALEAARILAPAQFDRTIVVACWDEFERGALGSAAYAARAALREERVTMAFALDSIAFVNREPNSQRVPEDFEHWFPEQALALLENDYRADFLLIVVDDRSAPVANLLARHGQKVGLPIETLRLTARQKHERTGMHRRDQASFWDRELGAVLLTDSAQYRNPRVGCHEGADTPDALDYAFAARVVQAVVGAAADLAVIRR